MKRFIVERDMPGVGKADRAMLEQTAAASCDAQRRVGAGVEWVESYIADDKTFCVYYAEDEERIRAHGREAGFPITAIREVRSMLDPTMERRA
jgi:hypothetical protein